MGKPVQIDPVGCGCTECLIGEYIPLDQAVWWHIDAMAKKQIRNASSDEFAVYSDGTYISRYSKLRWVNPLTETFNQHLEWGSFS